MDPPNTVQYHKLIPFNKIGPVCSLVCLQKNEMTSYASNLSNAEASVCSEYENIT